MGARIYLAVDRPVIGRNLVCCAPYGIFIIPEGGHGVMSGNVRFLQSEGRIELKQPDKILSS
ncbi:MAG: hypothetical protein IPM91_19260 [Bacteroidetes bacterium]|nr:hypothetical protein [Bacteroidota bacterium]